MSTDRYLEELAGRLRDGGVPAGRVADMIDDLAGYLAEAGTGPEEEFGPVGAFADQLAAAAPPHGGGPSEADESWAFHADAFTEMALMREFGEQGWEVVSYDIATGFDCRRSLERPQRWEYRREAVPPRRRQAVGTRLAEDGWEIAATFGFWHYFKRPVAAVAGPAAELDAPLAPPTAPTRPFVLTRTFAIWYIAGLLAVTVVLSLILSDSGSRLSAVSGSLAGMSLVIGCCAAFIQYQRRKASRG